MTWHSIVYLLLFDLAAFGLAFVLGYSEITFWFRDRFRSQGFALRWLVKLMECPACLGFWLGAAAGLFPWFWWLSRDLFGWSALAFQCVAVNLLLGRITGLIED